MVAEMRQKNNKNIQLNKQKNQNLKLNTFWDKWTDNKIR
jgi:hypothetical protein